MIAGNVVIRVLVVQSGRVRLGIEATDEVVVHREEVAARPALSDPDSEARPALIPMG